MKSKIGIVLLTVMLLCALMFSALATEWIGRYETKDPNLTIKAGDILKNGFGLHGYINVSGDYKCTYWADWGVSWGSAHRDYYVDSFRYSSGQVYIDGHYVSNDGYPDDDDNHYYGAASYEWSNGQCNARAVCTRGNCKHEATETVTGTYVKDADATCVTPEKGHYMAVFENQAFETQTTETQEFGSPIDCHTFGNADYQWNGNECTAERVCTREGCGEKETETVTGTYVKDADATCEAPEKGHYEAVFENDAFEDQATDPESVSIGEALGHKYREWRILEEAQTTKSGRRQMRCKRCGDMIIERIPRLKVDPEAEKTYLLKNGQEMKMDIVKDESLWTIQVSAESGLIADECLELRLTKEDVQKLLAEGCGQIRLLSASGKVSVLIPAADFQVILDGVGGDKLSVFVSETGETCGACALAFEGEESVSVTVYKEEQALPIDVAQFANIVIA